MEIALFAAVIVILLGGFWYTAQAFKKSAAESAKPKDDGQSMVMLQNQIAELNRTRWIRNLRARPATARSASSAKARRSSRT